MEEKWEPFETYTEYSSNDEAAVSEAWNRYNINGVVALPQSWAVDRHWPTGREMPGDTDKGIYVVDGFHQLHCLVWLQSPASTLKSSLIDTS